VTAANVSAINALAVPRALCKPSRAWMHDAKVGCSHAARVAQEMVGLLACRMPSQMLATSIEQG